MGVSRPLKALRGEAIEYRSGNCEVKRASPPSGSKNTPWHCSGLRVRGSRSIRSEGVLSFGRQRSVRREGQRQLRQNTAERRAEPSRCKALTTA